MNQQDILRALDSCEISMRVSFPDARPLRALRDSRKVPKSTKVSHVFWMIDQAREFAHEDRLPKAFRWLGFVQGVMWSLGIVTIEEAKEANRPKEVEQETRPTPTFTIIADAPLSEIAVADTTGFSVAPACKVSISSGDDGRDSYMAFMRGWTDSAGIRPIREEFAKHATLADVYHEGYDVGREARGLAREAAEKRFGYQEKILRTPEPITICTCPATSEWDDPCPRHDVLGIGVTGR